MGWWGAMRLQRTGESAVEQILPGGKQRFLPFPAFPAFPHVPQQSISTALYPSSLLLGTSFLGGTLSTYSVPSMITEGEIFPDPNGSLL